MVSKINCQVVESLNLSDLYSGINYDVPSQKQFIT